MPDQRSQRARVLVVDDEPAERESLARLIGLNVFEEFNAQNNRSVPGLTPEAEEALLRYHWPGNVRELRNAMHRAVVHLPPTVLGGASRPACAAESSAVVPLREVERAMIVRALEAANYHKPRAAAMLGISLKTLYNKVARFGLAPNRASTS